jgi:hypothetical protein
MFGFKKLLIAGVGLVSLSLLATLAPRASRGQVQPIPGLDNLRGSFYLTKTAHSGSQARSACATGYHMASLWEIFDPSNHKYDHVLGKTSPDAGVGPPTYSLQIGGSLGWIRTGSLAQEVPPSWPGRGHCGGWTRTDAVLSGTVVGLIGDWTGPGTAISPWHATVARCDLDFPVWCVADRDLQR